MSITIETEAECLARLTKLATALLVGRRITGVRYESAKEAGGEDCNRALLIQLDSGTVLTPMCNELGDDAAAIIYTIPAKPSNVRGVLSRFIPTATEEDKSEEV